MQIRVGPVRQTCVVAAQPAARPCARKRCRCRTGPSPVVCLGCCLRGVVGSGPCRPWQERKQNIGCLSSAAGRRSRQMARGDAMLLPMSMMVADCPRCKAAQITFDVLSGTLAGEEHGWKRYFELYCCRRRCFQGSIIKVSMRDFETSKFFKTIDAILQGKFSLNRVFNIYDYVSLKDHTSINPPEHLPPNVEKAFKEGATCLAVGCYNARGAMFRLAIDLASKSLLPEGDGTSPSISLAVTPRALATSGFGV